MLIWPDDFPQPYSTILSLAAREPHAAINRATEQALVVGHVRDQALAAYTLGCCLLAGEQFAAVQAQLAAAAAWFTTAPMHWQLHYRLVLSMHALLTNQPTATDNWEQLVADFEANGCAAGAVMAATWLTRACYSQRDLDRVEQLVAVWLPRSLTANVPLASGILMRLRGAIAITRSDYQTAARWLQLALARLSSAGLPLEANHCLIDSAWLAINEGRLMDAQTALDRAVPIFQHHQLLLRLALCALNRSIIHMLLGHFAQALQQQQFARTCFLQLDCLLDVGSCDLQLGKLYASVGHWSAAAAQFTSAIHIFQGFNAAGRLASCMYNLATALLGLGLINQASHALEWASSGIRGEPDHELRLEILLEQAHVLTLQGQVTDADMLYMQAASRFQQQHMMVGWARCSVERGFLALQCGATSVAQELFAHSTQHLDQHASYAWRCLYGLARCAELQGESAAAMRLYVRAIDQIALIRRQILSEHLSSMLFVYVEDVVADALRFAVALDAAEFMLQIVACHRTLTLQWLMTTPAATQMNQTTLAEIQQRLDGLISALNFSAEAADPQLLGALDQQLQHYARELWLGRCELPLPVQEPAPLDPALVRRCCMELHGTDWTILSFMLLRTTLYTVIQTVEGISCLSVPWDTQTERLIHELHAVGTQRLTYYDVPYYQELTTQRWAALADLAAYLIPAHVQARLGPLHRLYIVPSGSLHSLAWATLRIGDHWLGEQAIIQLVPNLSFFDLPKSASARTMTQLGCSTFGDRAEPLPAVAEELAAIAQIWVGPVKRLFDADCTVAAICDPAFADQLATSSVLHIATHSTIWRHFGLAGHIMLYDGNLWLDQITHLRLGYALVVMSSCSGALVDALAGEENISLTWSWLIAGAGAVVASLWPVPDGALIGVYRVFYAYLNAGVDAAQALALAQRDQLSCEDASPIVWGSLIITGHPMMGFC